MDTVPEQGLFHAGAAFPGTKRRPLVNPIGPPSHYCPLATIHISLTCTAVTFCATTVLYAATLLCAATRQR